MLTPIENVAGDDADDTRRLRAMAAEAREYITSFKWCLPIKAMFLADGFGEIIAIFLFEFEGMVGGTDDRLWVVVGDLPSAYMVVEPQDCAREALERYCELMEDWINAVLITHNFDDVFPVDAAESSTNAEDLRSRLGFLRREIIPHINADLIDT
jgi:hypothetical protein